MVRIPRRNTPPPRLAKIGASRRLKVGEGYNRRPFFKCDSIRETLIKSNFVIPANAGIQHV
jgi:hypothetical protein